VEAGATIDHCSLMRLRYGLNDTHFATKSQLVEAAQRFDEFFATLFITKCLIKVSTPR
jgi:hypothetical protein